MHVTSVSLHLAKIRFLASNPSLKRLGQQRDVRRTVVECGHVEEPTAELRGVLSYENDH